MSELLNAQEVLSKATELSRKFRGFTSKDDLIQEGVLAYYEAVNAGVDNIDRALTNMRKAMYAYANYHNKPTKIPVSGKNYRLTKDLPPEEYEGLTEQEKAVYAALRHSSKDLGDYEDKLEQSGLPVEISLAIRQGFFKLKPYERAVIVGLILEGLDTTTVGELLGMDRRRVGDMRNTALAKLKKMII